MLFFVKYFYEKIEQIRSYKRYNQSWRLFKSCLKMISCENLRVVIAKKLRGLCAKDV